MLAAGSVPPLSARIKRCALDYANAAPANNLYELLYPEADQLRARLATLIGCTPEEVALTRNTTEAITTAIAGTDLQAGDEVVTTEIEYETFLALLRQRAVREKIVVKTVPLPLLPSSPDDLALPIERAMTAKTKLVLICHMHWQNGHILPVQCICTYARARGIPVIVDGAHGVGQLPCDMRAMGCDYYGASLHKWMAAPIGSGFLYVRRERIAALWPLFGSLEKSPDRIQKLEWRGTVPPTLSAVGPALDLHEGIGLARKQARFAYLTRYWTERLRGIPGLTLRTVVNPELSCGIANLGVEGVGGRALYSHLRKVHRILT